MLRREGSTSIPEGVTVERVRVPVQGTVVPWSRTGSFVPSGRPADHDTIPEDVHRWVRDRGVHERRGPTPFDRLTERERQVLGGMADGASNAGIAHDLHVSERTVEAATAQVFRKLSLERSPLTNRRVLAVLTYLTQRGAGG